MMGYSGCPETMIGFRAFKNKGLWNCHGCRWILIGRTPSPPHLYEKALIIQGFFVSAFREKIPVRENDYPGIAQDCSV